MRKFYLIAVMIFTAIYANAQCDCTNEAVTGVPQAECEALVALYNSTDGANWKDNTNWNTTTNISSWFGVNTSMGHVKYLRLYYNKLKGTIPSSVGDLSELSMLNLGNNDLSGEIPLSVWNLTNLTSLNLHMNKLSGNIPASIGNLTQLNSLNLGSNDISGIIPTELFGLTQINSLTLADMNLSGDISVLLTNISQLTNLTELYLSGNRFSGVLPANIDNLLPQLEILYVSRMEGITGEIPNSICNMSNLKRISFMNNNMSGSIPSDIGNLINLTELNLSGNNFSGMLPSSMYSLINLETFSLSGSFTTLTNEIGNLTQLKTLWLQNNSFTSIPNTIGNLTNLTRLDLSNNQLNSLPEELTMLTAIQTSQLELCGNNIKATGTLSTFLDEKAPGWKACQDDAEKETGDFGTVKYGEKKIIMLPVRNAGNADMLISKVTVTPSPPFVILSYPQIVGPNETGYIAVSYSPVRTRGTVDNGTITIEHNAAGSPTTVTIQGTGTNNEYEILNNGQKLTLGQENIVSDVTIGQMQTFDIQNATNIALNFTVNGQNQIIAAFDKISVQKITTEGTNQINFDDNGGLTTIAKWLGSSIPAVPLDNWGIYLTVFLLISFVVIKSKIS